MFAHVVYNPIVNNFYWIEEKDYFLKKTLWFYVNLVDIWISIEFFGFYYCCCATNSKFQTRTHEYIERDENLFSYGWTWYNLNVDVVVISNANLIKFLLKISHIFYEKQLFRLKCDTNIIKFWKFKICCGLIRFYGEIDVKSLIYFYYLFFLVHDLEILIVSIPKYSHYYGFIYTQKSISQGKKIER